MEHSEMLDITNDIGDRIIELLQTKGAEYGSDDDILADFKESAADAGVTPLQSWLIQVQKHERAIESYVRRAETVSNESIQSRVVDVMVYHLLLLGLIADLEPLDRRRLPKIDERVRILNPRDGQTAVDGTVVKADQDEVVIHYSSGAVAGGLWPVNYIATARGWRWQERGVITCNTLEIEE
jgi:hypothetical protein